MCSVDKNHKQMLVLICFMYAYNYCNAVVFFFFNNIKTLKMFQKKLLSEKNTAFFFVVVVFCLFTILIVLEKYIMKNMYNNFYQAKN